MTKNAKKTQPPKPGEIRIVFSTDADKETYKKVLSYERKIKPTAFAKIAIATYLELLESGIKTL